MNRLPKEGPEPKPAPIILEIYAKGGLKDKEIVEILTPRLRELGFTHDVKVAIQETPDGVSSYYTCEVLGLLGGQG